MTSREMTMGNVVTFEPKPTTDEYFGGCPHCGRSDGYVNVGREHWFSCGRHKTKWRAGENLFSGWRDENEQLWQHNRFMLAEYMTVEPIYSASTTQREPVP